MPESGEPLVLPDQEQKQQTDTRTDRERVYLVICWDDPVNLMEYVTHVFQVVFGWTKQKAEVHMLQVHKQGKSVLARESLERAEHYVHQLQGYSLHATMEADSVKLLKRTAGRWTFHLAEKEKQLLLAVLGFYPVLDPSFQPLSKSSDRATLKDDQALLEEALLSRKQDNAQALQKTFGEGKCFSKSSPGWRLALNGQQIEMLLQVLNDIRVGSWRNLGCPEPRQEGKLARTEANLRSLFAMQVGGHFQTSLLEALDHDAGPD